MSSPTNPSPTLSLWWNLIDISRSVCKMNSMTEEVPFRDFTHRRHGELGPMNPPVRGVPLSTPGSSMSPQKAGALLCKVAAKSKSGGRGKSKGHAVKAGSKK